MDGIRQQKPTNGRMRRPCARINLQIMLGTLLTLVLLRPAQAAVFNIASGDGAALINAINTANGNSEDDTINLPAGTYTLRAVNNDTDGPNGLPLIASAITIHGAGADSTVLARTDGAPEFRIVHVAATGVLTLDNVTLTGASGTSGIGGSIFNLGKVTVLSSTVSNSSNGLVGGIFNNGTLSLLNSSVSGNGGSDVGGISNSGTLSLLNSSVSGNGGPNAGGISNRGTLTVSNSTISYNGGDVGGGGIVNSLGTATIVNSTISSNFSFGFCGGLCNDGGKMTLINSTVSSNNTTQWGFAPGILSENGGTVEMTHSIVVGNTITGDFGDFLVDCVFFEQVTSLGHNLMGRFCPSDGPGDLAFDYSSMLVSDVLGPLQNNGGPTETHALVPRSPAPSMVMEMAPLPAISAPLNSHQ
jgi:hypothetical protein